MLAVANTREARLIVRASLTRFLLLKVHGILIVVGAQSGLICAFLVNSDCCTSGEGQCD